MFNVEPALPREQYIVVTPFYPKKEKYDGTASARNPLTQSLRDVLSADYRGPRAVFSEVHVLKAILAIGEAGSVGRGRLGSLVGLGQGEVRTLIKRLKENQLIVIEAEGCKLSRKGEREYRTLKEKIAWSSMVDAASLGIGSECAAVLVRGGGANVRKGLEQRDAAVRAGALGALTALFSRGRFTLPGDGTDVEKGGPRGLWSAARASAPRNGDVLIVAGASSPEAAEMGALAAALTVL